MALSEIAAGQSRDPFMHTRGHPRSDDVLAAISKRCSRPTFRAAQSGFTVAAALAAAAQVQGISSSMHEAGHRLTSFPSTSVIHASGSTAFNLQVSMSDAAVAQLSAPRSWPAKRAFLRLCRALHKRNYAQVRIMRSCRAACAESPVDGPSLNAPSRSSCT